MLFFRKKVKKQDMQEVQQQVKGRIEASQEQIKQAAVDTIDKTGKIKEEFKSVADEQIYSLSRHVQEKPIKAIVVSTIVGYLLGRITR